MPKNNQRQLEKKIRSVILVILIICIGTAIGLVFTPIFHVQEVWCEGNNRISQEEILGVAQVELGKNIFSQSLSGIKGRVEQISMIEEAKAKRIFPNKIKIWVRECVPAGYIHTDNKLVVSDMSGIVLEIIDDGRVQDMLTLYTPEENEKNESNEEKPKDGEKPENSASPEKSEKEETTESVETEENEINKSEIVIDWAHQIPLVVGLELEKTDVSKKIDSKERDKLNKVMDTIRNLEKAGLLSRATYLDVTYINDIVLVIENRLKILLGDLENMEYRCMFLAKVINEKISSTESVIMDYRTKDIYVRQPDDGKERMIPKDDEADDEKSETEETSSEKSDDTQENNDDEKPVQKPKPMSSL